MRGKAAAKSANRRAQHVLQRAEAAEDALAAERSQNRERQANLEIEIQALRFELGEQAEQVAAERVATAIDTIQTQLNMLREEHRLAAIKVIAIIYNDVDVIQAEKVASLLGVTLNEIMAKQIEARKGPLARPERRRIATVSKREARTIAVNADRDAVLHPFRFSAAALDEERRITAEQKVLEQ